MKTRVLLLACGVLLALGCSSTPKEQAAEPAKAGLPSIERSVVDYATLVSQSYEKSHKDALKMQAAIGAFLQSPDPKSLAAAKAAWLDARKSYGVTEAFRFYEGPIDFVDPKTDQEGPEGRLNAWPLNEAYIDYVKGDAKAGIIQDASTPLSEELLVSRNATSDEANVTTGWHAIEFLLWGQDHSAQGPGTRPLSDYLGEGAITQRRKTYLGLVTKLLVSDLAGLAAAWKPDLENYRASFEAGESKSFGHILTGIATLAGFELASERIAVPLDSNDQEDEHSCFSDNTHDDFLQNVRGIERVWSASGLGALVATRDPKLAESIQAELKRALELCAQVTPPVDRILASPPKSKLRAPLEALVTSLQELAKSLQAAGKVFDLDVVIAGE